MSVDYWKEVRPHKGYFDAFRFFQYPTLYGENETPVTADVTLVGFIFAAAILAFSLLCILPGIRNGDRLSVFIRIIVAVFVLGAIMVSNFGQEWEVAHIYTKTAYKAGIRKEINASVGVKIGLRSINITLKGDPEVYTFNNGRVNETINYNERFSWNNHGWLLGRLGFGPYAGRFNQEFREHQRRGSPYPILWVAEYFTVDGEGIRWGRYFLQAGYFAHIMVWTALPLWILSLILFNMIIQYGAYFSIMTGLSLVIANLIWACVRNANPLKIPFEDGVLEFKWGWSFILCAFTGVLCCVIGIVIVILDHVIPEELSNFFGIDITKDLEEFFVDPDQLDEIGDSSSGYWARRKRSRRPTIILRTGHQGRNSRESEQTESSTDIELGPRSSSDGRLSSASEGQIERGYRKKTVFPTKRSKKRNPRPVAGGPNSPTSPTNLNKIILNRE